MNSNSTSNLIWIAAAAAAAYALYEWLQSQCALTTSSFYGGSICSALGLPAAAAVTTTTTTPAAAPAPLTTTSPNVAAAQATSTATPNPGGLTPQQIAAIGVLQAFGIPSDVKPMGALGTGGGCNVTSLGEGLPVPAAPFFSPSTGKYYCGPANVWQFMTGQTYGPEVALTSTSLATAPPLITPPPIVPPLASPAPFVCPPNAVCNVPASLPMAGNLVPAPLLTGSPVLPPPPPATNLIPGGVQGLSANRVPYHLIHRRAA